MSEQHTPEPWSVTVLFNDGGYRIIDKEYDAVCDLYFRDNGKILDHENAEANARRIVACVNALSSVSTEDLEKHAAEQLQSIKLPEQ